jgi:hypothetical protein
MKMSSEQSSGGDDPIALTEWLEKQKQRAEKHIEDERVDNDETLRWKGERELISAIQAYLESGVVELE